MTAPSRRDFLRLSAASAVGASLHPSIARALSIAPARRTGTVCDVEHVVILMQENRSFDHYFGSMRGVRGFSDPRPQPLPSGLPVWFQPAASVRTAKFESRGLPADAAHVLPFYLNPRETTEHQAGTDHGWSSGHLAWNHGHHDSWVTHKQDVLTMGYLRREDVSFHYALAEAFTLCDSYFCSIHADTCPNRIYLWSGTIDPRNAYGTRANGPGLEERSHTNGYTWTTYPERLQKAGVSWKVYQGGTGDPGDDTDNYTDNSLEFFARYQVKEGAAPDDPHVLKGVTDCSLRALREDAVAGRLPQVSWVVAPYKYCEHPEASPTDGARFIARVLDALTADPAVWASTVLLINYDENDGLFDHVVPPMPPQPDSGADDRGLVSASLHPSLEDEFLDLDLFPHEAHPIVHGADPRGVQPIGLGPRVPMLVVSPWSRGGWVCSEVFDHTSVLRFLEVRFGVEEPNISEWRRSVCGDLCSAFDFADHRGTPLPSLPVPAALPSRGAPYMVPAVQTMPVQEGGTRPARALPYACEARWRAGQSGRVELAFANQGRAGMAFYVYTLHDRAQPPRRYTAAAGDTLHDVWSVRPAEGELAAGAAPPLRAKAAYHLALFGPNGYVSEARGDARGEEPLLAELHPQPAAGVVELVLTNSGPVALTVRVAERYSGAERVLRVPGGRQRRVTLEVGQQAGWFDTWATIEAPSPFLRRWAGHLENGKPSTSDPGRARPEEWVQV